MLVEVGNNVVVDYVVFDRDLLRDAATCWAELDGVFVGTKPPLEVSEEWERKRGDRDLGQARCAFAATHAHGRYDLVIDPSVSSPEESARLILAHLRVGHPRMALRQLRDEYDEQGLLPV